MARKEISMNKYEVELDIVKSAVSEVNPNQAQLRKAYHAIQQLRKACEKAEKYDELIIDMQYLNWKKREDVNHAQENTAKEIIEMLTIKGEYSFWTYGRSSHSQDIIQKIKERYGIKE